MLLGQCNDVNLACGAAFSKVPSKCWILVFSLRGRRFRAAPAAFSRGCFKEDTLANFPSCAFRMWVNYQGQHSTGWWGRQIFKLNFRSIPLSCATSGQTSWNALCLLLIGTLYFGNCRFIYASVSSEICRYESSLRDSNTQYFLCHVPLVFLKSAAGTVKTVKQRNHPASFLAFG